MIEFLQRNLPQIDTVLLDYLVLGRGLGEAVAFLLYLNYSFTQDAAMRVLGVLLTILILGKSVLWRILPRSGEFRGGFRQVGEVIGGFRQ